MFNVRDGVIANTNKLSLVLLADWVLRKAFRFDDRQCVAHASIYYKVLLVGGRVLELHGYCTWSRLVAISIPNLHRNGESKCQRLLVAVKSWNDGSFWQKSRYLGRGSFNFLFVWRNCSWILHRVGLFGLGAVCLHVTSLVSRQSPCRAWHTCTYSDPVCDLSLFTITCLMSWTKFCV